MVSRPQCVTVAFLCFLTDAVVINHLQLIYNTAPDRVVICGLVSQGEKGSGASRTCDTSSLYLYLSGSLTYSLVNAIYVHSKVTICDDKVLVTGSCNLDNVSLFYSSELVRTKIRETLALQMELSDLILSVHCCT